MDNKEKQALFESRQYIKCLTFYVLKVYLKPQNALVAARSLMESIKSVLEDDDIDWIKNYAKILTASYYFSEASILYSKILSRQEYFSYYI